MLIPLIFYFDFNEIHSLKSFKHSCFSSLISDIVESPKIFATISVSPFPSFFSLLLVFLSMKNESFYLKKQNRRMSWMASESVSLWCDRRLFEAGGVSCQHWVWVAADHDPITRWSHWGIGSVGSPAAISAWDQSMYRLEEGGLI